MRFTDLFENADYAMAKKLFPTLSHQAQRALNSWESSNWGQGQLTTSFETNSEIAQEIEEVFAPVRERMRQRHGDTIKLYRGIVRDERFKPRDDRKLFSWTSTKAIAAQFAGARRSYGKRKADITPEQIEKALKTYEKYGKLKFGRTIYIKSKTNPQYYDIYQGSLNNHITDGDDLRRDLENRAKDINDYNQKADDIEGEIIEKEIPIDDIVWVMMSGSSNEYIVKGHPE